MEIGDIIKFNDEDYKIVKRLYRKVSSVGNNILVENPSGVEIEPRRNFYIVEKDYTQYFVKEYVDIEYGGHAEYEYDLMKRLSNLPATLQGNSNIDIVKPIAINGETILMEYLYDYYPLNDVSLNLEAKSLISYLFLKWLKEHIVSDLQITRSNFMVKVINDQVKIKLVDFERSIGHNEKEWFKFLSSFMLAEN